MYSSNVVWVYPWFFFSFKINDPIDMEIENGTHENFDKLQRH